MMEQQGLAPVLFVAVDAETHAGLQSLGLHAVLYGLDDAKLARLKNIRLLVRWTGAA